MKEEYNMSLSKILACISPLDETAMQAARARQDTLTKPTGSLGRLETLSVQLAGITGQPRPRLAPRAGHHRHGRRSRHRPQRGQPLSAEVTPQMVLNFLHGGAAINVLARHVDARLTVADLGVASDLADDA